jgi:hypothetical protein
MTKAPTTLHDLAAERRANDRPTHVHVVGDFNHDPPKGLDVAKDIAALLVDEGRTVRADDFGDLQDGDVAFVRIDEPPDRSYEERQELRQLAHLLRVNRLAGIVVFTETVDRAVEEILDARVLAESGDVDHVEKLELNPYDGGVLAIEMEGVR